MRRTLFYIIIIITSIQSYAQVTSIRHKIPDQQLIKILTGDRWYSTEPIQITSAVSDNNEIRIRFNKTAATALITTQKISTMTDSVRIWSENEKAKVSFYAEQKNLSLLIPHNYTIPTSELPPIVVKADTNHLKYELSKRTFAIWNSHGRYYEKSLNRWEWQRARLFTTVEDLLSSSFVLPYLVPMIENAGAYVFMPRERDTNNICYIADNEDKNTFSSNNLKPTKTTIGYKYCPIIKNNDNPFRAGTAEFFSLKHGDTLTFKINTSPDIPKQKMAVYVAYPQDKSNSNNVSYTIKNDREEATYIVDQQRGGAMWIFLGKHHITPNTRILISGIGQVAIDAIRIGGGEGIVARDGQTSGISAWAEGARYYLQADGWDCDIYSPSDKPNDYTDDINCRGEWVNALQKQKYINIDASFAIHTDAGIATADTTIGTLAIVTTQNSTGKYSDGRSKNIARSLAQTIEMQIISDIRATWNSTWSQRGIWDKGYSESRRPDVPAVLLELLSHQNITDMHYALHPRFRFDMCRSIYKAILRFFEGNDATIQPLPIQKFGLEQTAPDSIKLSWQPTPDPLELNAIPTRYHIYAHTIGGAEQRVAISTDTTITLRQIPNNKITEYYIIAENNGGLSFPSQHLSARLNGGKVQLLRINGFDRISAPAIVNEPNWRGIIDNIDPAIPDGTDYFRTGAQYDYDPQSEWTDDDAPGCGASYANDEMKQINYHYEHYPLQTYIEQTKDYFENSNSNVPDSVSIELGYQRSTWYGNMPEQHSIYTKLFLNRLEYISNTCKTLSISGAYVGTDIPNVEIAQRIEKLLGFKHRTNHASKSAFRTFTNSIGKYYKINIQHPDAIEPVQGAYTTERYTDTGMSAQIKYKNIIVSGY